MLCTLFLTGCYNYKELNELGIVSAIGISKEDDTYKLDIQLINVLDSEKNGTNKSPITVISGEGKTIFEAARSMNKKTSKIFFLADVDYVFLDKSVIENNLEEIMDFLVRDTRLSLNFLVITSSENKSKEILSSISHYDMNQANNIYDEIINSQNRFGGITSLHVRDLINNYYSNIDTIYPNVIINNSKKSTENKVLEDSNNDSYVEVKNMIFYKDNKDISLTEEETKGLNFIKNNIKNITMTIKCNSGYFTIETLSNKVKLKNNKNKINVKLDIGSEIVYYGCKDDLNKTSVLSNISKKAEMEVQKYIEESLIKSKTYNYDYLGLKNYIYKHDYNYYKDNNKDLLNNIELTYDIDVSLYKQGNLRGDL